MTTPMRGRQILMDELLDILAWKGSDWERADLIITKHIAPMEREIAELREATARIPELMRYKWNDEAMRQVIERSDAAETTLAAEREKVEKLRRVLQTLVQLKAVKDHGKTVAYLRDMPLAWEAARRTLDETGGQG